MLQSVQSCQMGNMNPELAGRGHLHWDRICLLNLDITIHGTCDLLVVNGKLDQFQYNDVLEGNLFQSVDNMFGDRDFTFHEGRQFQMPHGPHNEQTSRSSYRPQTAVACPASRCQPDRKYMGRPLTGSHQRQTCHQGYLSVCSVNGPL